jgi:DNA mismatch endonuclease, patch repair protein
MSRSANMRAIRSKGMRPELEVRHLVHKLGYRFRLHRTDLPGTPDLVFPSRRKVIFVHGCFWHAHGCKYSHVPKSNTDYWKPKLRRNHARDAKNLKALGARGWRALVIWECEIKSGRALVERISAFLTDRRKAPLCASRGGERLTSAKNSSARLRAELRGVQLRPPLFSRGKALLSHRTTKDRGVSGKSSDRAVHR